MGSEPAHYLESALDWIEQNALRRHAVDWSLLRGRARDIAKDAPDMAGCHTAIEEALRSLGDGHSVLRLRSRPQDLAEPSPTRLPSAVLLEPGIGLLALPGVSTHGEAAMPYPRAGHAALRALSDKARAWVVDLRANEGGNMWPMLLAVGPLLGEGAAGRFVYPARDEQRWGYVSGAVFLADNTIATLTDPIAPLGPMPVSVITGSVTRSSGEAIALAFRGRPRTRTFGQPTSGAPTCNVLHRLDDGAAIALTVGWMADRSGNTFDGPIPPDELIDPGGELDAAARWLRAEIGTA